MDRRKFLRQGSLTGIGLSSVGGLSRLAGAVDGISSEKNSSKNPLDQNPVTRSGGNNSVRSSEKNAKR